MQQQVAPTTIALPDLDAAPAASANGVTVALPDLDGNSAASQADGAVQNLMSQLTALEVSPEVAQPLFTVKLTQQEKDKIRATSAGVDFDNALEISSFSESSQTALTTAIKKLNAYYGTARNLGGVGDLVLKMQKGIGLIDQLKAKAGQSTASDDALRKPEAKKSWMRRAMDAVEDVEVLGIGKKVATVELDTYREQELTKIFDSIEDDIKARRRAEVQSFAVLKTNAAAVEVNIREQIVFAIAGQYALARGQQEYNTAKQDEAALSGDPTAVTKLLQKKRNLESFARKLLEIKAWIVELALLTTPRISEMEQAVLSGIETLSRSLQRDLPRLVQAALDCGILFQLKDAQDRAAQLGDISNQVAQRSGELHREVAIQGKKAEGNVVNQVEILTQLGAKLLETKAELERIEAENKGKMKKAEEDLVTFAQTMQAGLKAQL